MDWDQIRSPRTLAEQMWTTDGLELDPTRFLELYHRVRSETDDLYALWRLGGATNDYLRHHPTAFPAPEDLARMLLAARHREARVIGLKLFTRCDVPADRFLAEVVRALNRKSDYEVCGGFHELSMWIDQQLARVIKFDPLVLAALTEALRRVTRSTSVSHNVEVARRQLELLPELCGSQVG
jgi:hypothetical protein